MTSHELAQKLLELPDLPVKLKIDETDQYGSYFRYTGVWAIEQGKTGCPLGETIILESA